MSINITTRGMFSGSSVSVATSGYIKPSLLSRILTGVKTIISRPLKYFITSKNTGDQ